MRLNRLDLTRYGKFTDRSIDFGAPTAGQPDLHIVYGPNEAGKSTALAGFLDLLYGIETRTRYGFLHPNSMRIGGALQIGDTCHELVRAKRGSNTLLDGEAQPIPEALLAGALGGIDRAAYRAMFSLDDETLEAGGESILASKGDLGHLLFGASAGLADLSRTLAVLREQADAIYRFHAHNTELNALKRRLAALKEERDGIDTAVSRYAALIEARGVAKQQYDAALVERGRIQARRDEVQRLLTALPRLAALHATQAALLPLAALPEPPEEWHEALPALQNETLALAVQAEAIESEIAAAAEALQAIVLDTTALESAGRFERLDGLRARFVTAEKDIPVRRQEAREAEAQVAAILARIGRTHEAEPARLVLDAAMAGTLQDLITRHSGIDTARQTAERELADARAQLQAAEAALPAEAGAADAGTGSASLTEVSMALAAVQASDHAARYRVAERAQARQREALDASLVALRPWQGDIAQLGALAIPEPGELQNCQDELAAAQTQHARRAQELDRAKAEQARLASEHAAITGSTGVVGEQQAAVIRAAREAAWAAHRRTLDADSADAFEAALRQDDLVTNAVLRHEAAVARLNANQEAAARAGFETGRAQEEFDKAALRLQRIEARVAAIITPLASGATLEALRTWLARRDKALEARDALQQAERDRRDADADAAALRQHLLAALQAAGLAPDAAATLGALRIAAQGVLDRARERKALQHALQERRRELQARERRLKTATERDAAWQEAWRAACAGCWLGEAGATPAISGVRAILATLADLAPALQRRDSLAERIAAMQADQREYATGLAAVAAALGEDGAAAPLDLADRIGRRVAAARSAKTLRDSKARDLADAQERQRAHDARQRTHHTQCREMQALFGAASLAELAAALDAVARRRVLQREAAAAERDILQALRAATLAQAEQRLAAADTPALEAELATLQPQYDDQDQLVQTQFAAFSRASDQVEGVGGDDAVARLDAQRRTVLLEIEDRAVHYLRLRVGIVAAEHALRVYRQEHRSGMMAQASDAFRLVSREAYRGLATQPGKERDREDVIALGADGNSKEAASLSKGTRFQLYLALRVAGYREFARLRSPVPFIADDIMETFDNDRAEQALRLMARIGEVGQAVYLTHHWHLCEIAQRIYPDVRIHLL
jgi:uncharacterized protein YhaN